MRAPRTGRAPRRGRRAAPSDTAPAERSTVRAPRRVDAARRRVAFVAGDDEAAISDARGRAGRPTAPRASAAPALLIAIDTSVSSGSDSRRCRGAVRPARARACAAGPASQDGSHPAFVAALTAGIGRTRSVTSVTTPKRALRPEDEPAQVRAGGAARHRRQHQLADRRRHPQADDEVVDAAVAGRRLTGGPGHDVAAERRAFEALRHMAEGEAVLGERRLRGGRADARLERRRAATPRRRRGARPAGARSRAITARCRRGATSRPPTTLVPPPHGTTATSFSPHDLQDRGDRGGVAGQHDRIRCRAARRRARRRTMST